MNILLLTQIVPYPPDSGPKVKTYHVLRYLAEQGHRVTLASFVRSHEQGHLEHLRSFCAAVHAVPMRRSRLADVRAYAGSLRSGLPFLVARDDRREMHELVRTLTSEQRFDIVHADQLTMGQFALSAVSGKRVFDAHNAVWTIVERGQRTAMLPLKPVLGREARLLKTYEGWLCRQMDAVLAVSDVDKRLLVEAGAPPERFTIIPIAVDCATLAPVSRDPRSTGILTASTLFYPPNADGVRWFLHDVYPRVRQAAPAATLAIVGPRPPKDLVQAGVDKPDAVTVTGYVPDLVPYLEQAAVMIVPVRAASGMRVRILEALARGVPVVTTTTGVEGIDAVNGEHLLVADEPADVAAAVARVLREPELGARLAAAGRRLVEEKYDWRVALPALEAMYASLVRGA